ncbi:hypothetical protein D3C72_1663260 [compost metagenome]
MVSWVSMLSFRNFSCTSSQLPNASQLEASAPNRFRSDKVSALFVNSVTAAMVLVVVSTEVASDMPATILAIKLPRASRSSADSSSPAAIPMSFASTELAAAPNAPEEQFPLLAAAPAHPTIPCRRARAASESAPSPMESASFLTCDAPRPWK